MPGVTTAYQTGIHSARPAASAGCILYSCTTHNKVYRSDGATWTDWVVIASGLANPMTSTGDIIYSSDGSGTPARLAAASDGDVLTLASGLPSWAPPAATGAVAAAVATASGTSVSLAHSTSFADVDATNLSLTISIGSNSRVRVSFAGLASQGSGGTTLGFGFAVDGTDFPGAGNVMTGAFLAGVVPVAFSALTGVLASGSHTFKLRYLNTSGSAATLFSTGAGTFITFNVEEVPV